MSASQMPTRAYLSQGSRPQPGRLTHCAVGDRSTGSHFDVELAALLRRRLRFVSLLLFVPALLFLVVDLIDEASGRPAGVGKLAVHATTVALLGWLAAVLWLPREPGLCTLRKIEVALFGSMAAFFGFLQVRAFSETDLFDASACVVERQHAVQVVRLWIDATAARWLFLIIVYGVFVPNTWRRCAAIAGLMALTPLVVTPLGAWAHGRFCPQATVALLDMAIGLGAAFVVAVFGSYRLQALHEEAFQARRLGQYRLGKKIGQGGMGEVYRAEHVLLRRPCAIKLIRPDQQGDADLAVRFEREVRAMAALTHPNTVEVYDFGVSPDGTFYYVMEYLPGLNLDALVTKYGPMPAARAVHFLRQVCKALREAHAVGLLHRDVKPSNVIAAQRGGTFDVAKLLDFGLVQDAGVPAGAGRLTLQGTVLGSPPYLSPEQAAGRSDVDARADVYSLGGVGYFLLTGRPPFVRETAMEMLLAHAYEEPSPLREVRPEVPADVEAVILRSLRKKPGERYGSADEMEKALAACQAAGGWGEDEAQAWWKGVPTEAETSAVIPTLLTPRAAESARQGATR